MRTVKESIQESAQIIKSKLLRIFKMIAEGGGTSGGGPRRSASSLMAQLIRQRNENTPRR
jgi:hypothetical protein